MRIHRTDDDTLLSQAIYEAYEREDGRARQTIKARKLWQKIIAVQTETGTPYMLYKDACNRKSNHQNLGTIRCSNLCTEIIEYTAPDEAAVCNLASMVLPTYVDTANKNFDHQKLHDTVKVVTRNLNRIIDVNSYPIPEAKYSNLRNRPIGIGVQGLADVFMKLALPFESEEARYLNTAIFETIYHAALEASCELAEIDGPYETYANSPVSKGILQFDMWTSGASKLTGRWDWNALRKKITAHGIRNSLLVAPMPTASTSQIMGSNECFEPYTSNIYSRRVLSGEFQMVNKWLLMDLINLGLWSEQMRNALIADNGSIQRCKLFHMMLICFINDQSIDHLFRISR